MLRAWLNLDYNGEPPGGKKANSELVTKDKLLQDQMLSYQPNPQGTHIPFMID